MTLQHIGTLHMSKSRPLVTTTNGAWQVTLRGLDPVSPHRRESWHLIWSGDAARAWWDREGSTLESGDTLRVVLVRARIHLITGDRYATTSELHADVQELEVVARARKAEAA